MKKLLIFLIFILILAVAGWFIIASKTGPQGSGDTEGRNSGFFSNLFPFTGSATEEERPIIETDEVNEENRPLLGGGGAGNRLQQLTNTAIAGYVGSTTANGNVVRYIERATGNAFEIDENGNTERITNTTIPGVHEAVWHQNLENVILRYVNENDVIKTYLGTIVSAENATTSEDIDMITGIFLSDDIPQLIPNRNNTRILYLEPFQTGVRGVTSDFEGEGSPVFTSLFSEWLVEWPDDNTLVATTKAASDVSGFTYKVEEDGSFSKLLGGRTGLTTLISPDLEFILLSESKERSLATYLWDGSELEPSTLSLKTLPEKCAWDTSREGSYIAYCGVPSAVTSAQYPDVWYQGLVSFEDDVWKIDAEQNTVQVIVSPQTLVGTSIDIVNPTVSSDGETLYFINKKDATLWSLLLQPEQATTQEGS